MKHEAEQRPVRTSVFSLTWWWRTIKNEGVPIEIRPQNLRQLQCYIFKSVEARHWSWKEQLMKSSQGVSEGATPYHMIFIYIKAMGFAWLSWKCSHFNLKQTLSDIFQFTHHMVHLILHSINIKRNLKSWYVLQHGQDILKIRTSTNSFWWRWCDDT